MRTLVAIFDASEVGEGNEKKAKAKTKQKKPTTLPEAREGKGVEGRRIPGSYR